MAAAVGKGGSMTQAVLKLTVGLALGLAMPHAARADDAQWRAELDQAMVDYDQALSIREAEPDRARRMFRSSAQRLGSLVAAGIDNGPLEYDLGNCYLQAGDLGRAILHYRRAERLIPRDPLLMDNLREARSRRITNIEPTRRGAVIRNVFFWHFETTWISRVVACLITYAFFWLFLSVRAFFRRRAFVYAAMACFVVMLLLAGSVAAEYWATRHAPAGVVTAMDVVVSKGPGSGYQRQFEQPLQPGAEFRLRERRGEWWNIELPDGQTGWIEASSADLVTGSML